MSAVVLLHGIGGATWAGLLPALAPAPVLDWPLPGYGGTPMLPETSFPACAAALRDRLDREGIPRIDLLGHSIGGMLAQEFALAHPERVRSLVLYATTPAFGGRDPAFAEAFLAERLAPLGVPVAAGFPFGHVDPSWTLPLGVRARLDADAGTLALLEPAVRGPDGQGAE